MAEIEILGRSFSPEIFKRVLNEGYEAYLTKGPNRQCPYGSDQRNGCWSFGANQARKGYSRAQAWQNFKTQERM